MNALLVTFHAGGNVPPFVELGRELRRRGHGVSCMAQPSLRGVFEEADVSFHELSRGLPYSPYERMKLQAQYALFGRIFFDDGYGHDLLEAVQATAADVVVVDCYLFSAMAAAEAGKVPLVILVHTLLGFMDRTTAANLEAINAVRDRWSLAPVAAEWAWGDADTVLVASSPEIEPQTVQQRATHVGPIFDDRPDLSTGIRAAAGDRSHVLVALSTTYMEQEALLEKILAALAPLPVTATLTVGPEVDGREMVAPPNVELVRGWTRHAAVMGGAAAVICHGGHGTVSTALACGRPVLCLPLGRDQTFISQRIAELGAGLHLSADSAPAAIGAATMRLLTEPGFATRAGEVAVATRSRGRAVSLAADVVESIAARAGDS